MWLFNSENKSDDDDTLPILSRKKSETFAVEQQQENGSKNQNSNNNNNCIRKLDLRNNGVHNDNLTLRNACFWCINTIVLVIFMFIFVSLCFHSTGDWWKLLLMIMFFIIYCLACVTYVY